MASTLRTKDSDFRTQVNRPLKRMSPSCTSTAAGLAARRDIKLSLQCVGCAKTDPVRFKWGFGEGPLKDKFAFFEAYKNPIPMRRKTACKTPIFISKTGPVFALLNVNVPFLLPSPQIYPEVSFTNTIGQLQAKSGLFPQQDDAWSDKTQIFSGRILAKTSHDPS